MRTTLDSNRFSCYCAKIASQPRNHSLTIREIIDQVQDALKRVDDEDVALMMLNILLRVHGVNRHQNERVRLNLLSGTGDLTVPNSSR